MAKSKKATKYRVSEFGQVPLMREDLEEFFRMRPDLPADCRACSHALLRLALYPQEMTDPDTASWFPAFYAKHPGFCLEFLREMRVQFERKSAGEKWLRSFDALAHQKEKDPAIVARLAKAGVPIAPNQFRTAREKLRKRDELQRKRKLLKRRV